MEVLNEAFTTGTNVAKGFRSDGGIVVSKFQPMYCRSCQQTLMTDSRDRCDACGSSEVSPAGSPERIASSQADDLARMVAEKQAEPSPKRAVGVFGAIQQLVDTATTVPNVGNLSDADAERHARYHYRIVIAGCAFAFLGVMLGLVAAAGIVADEKHRGVQGILIAPFMFGAGGFVFGMALTCLIAPTAFLTGPVGRPWMNMIGTKKPALARIACAIFGLMVTAPLVLIGILIARS